MLLVHLTVLSILPLNKWNEMNRALGHLRAHIGLTGPGEPPEDGEMIEMTLSSRHRFEIRALAVWGRARYLSVTEAPHNTDYSTKLLTYSNLRFYMQHYTYIIFITHTPNGNKIKYVS